MKLFEHPDFEQAIIRAADHFRPRGLREASCVPSPRQAFSSEN